MRQMLQVIENNVESFIPDINLKACAYSLDYLARIAIHYTYSGGGGNAVLMRTSPESAHFAPDILGHQIGGIKVSRYKPPPGIASQHRSPTCYLHEGPPW